MPRGRPVQSQIRQNIVDILLFLKRGYGYDIYKVYREIFAPVTMRSIYYHLRKGLELGEFRIDKIEKTVGEYSWGPESEKIYYILGPNAKPGANEKIKEHFEKKKQSP